LKHAVQHNNIAMKVPYILYGVLRQIGLWCSVSESKCSVMMDSKISQNNLGRGRVATPGGTSHSIVQ